MWHFGCSMLRALARTRRLVCRHGSAWTAAPEIAALARCLERHATIAEAVHEHCGAEAFADACPGIGASVGAHLRHSLEHIQCCATAIEALRSDAACRPTLAYDERERDAALEADAAYAAARSRAVAETIVAGPGVALDATVLAAFALDSSADARAPSTLRRELVFVVHHATHHFFVAALVAKGHLGVALPDDVGRAPATLRNDSQRGAYIDIGG